MYWYAALFVFGAVGLWYLWIKSACPICKVGRMKEPLHRYNKKAHQLYMCNNCYYAEWRNK